MCVCVRECVCVFVDGCGRRSYDEAKDGGGTLAGRRGPPEDEHTQSDTELKEDGLMRFDPVSIFICIHPAAYLYMHYIYISCACSAQTACT